MQIMGPSKRKGPIRRQVLDLNAKEDSPSRPTWQSKCFHLLQNIRNITLVLTKINNFNI